MRKLLAVGCLIIVAMNAGCGNEENLRLKKENKQLKEENFSLRLENLELKKGAEKSQLQSKLGEIRSAITIYYGEMEGVYPQSLDALIPKYIDYIPAGDWEYNSKTGNVILKSHPAW